jgi:hypothetical protein
MSDDYDRRNREMSESFGPRSGIQASSGIQSAIGSVGGRGAWTAQEAAAMGRKGRENIEAAFDTLLKSRGGGGGGGASPQPWRPSIRLDGATVHVTPGAGKVWRSPTDIAPVTPTGVAVEVVRTAALFYLEIVGSVTSGAMGLTSCEIKQAAALPTAAGTSSAPLSYVPLFSVATDGVVTMHRAAHIELQPRIGFVSGAWLRFGVLAR